jgi:hypothetical protein
VVTFWLFFIFLSFAQEPESSSEAGEQSAEVETSGVEVGVEEVVVYGEVRVIQARKRVESKLKYGGYTLKEQKGDRTVFRHVTPWRGKVILHDDGWVKVKRQGLRIEGREWSFADRNSPEAWAMCVLTPWRCVRTGGFSVSKRKFQHYEGAAAELTVGEAEQWSARIADLSIDRKLELLDASLVLLWLEGLPLDGEVHIDTVIERRATILEYWSSRTDTVWGDRVRDAVAAFIRGEIQYSDFPYTDNEMMVFNEGKNSRERFPWGPELVDGVPDSSSMGAVSAE